MTQGLFDGIPVWLVFGPKEGVGVEQDAHQRPSMASTSSGGVSGIGALPSSGSLNRPASLPSTRRGGG